MTSAWLALGFLAVWGSAFGHYWRKDLHARRVAEARADTEAARATYWRDRATAAEQTLVDERVHWAAEIDVWALREHHHLTRCLGSRVEVGDMECN